MSKSSPYLKDSERLADVIAAIQAMGTYKFYKLEFKTWSDRISGDESKADHWQKVFEQHPEFFRLDKERKRASLVWRRQHPKRYDTTTESLLTKKEFYSLSDEGKKRVSRNALSEETIQALIETAIELHSRALLHQQDKRWLIQLIIGAMGGIIGVALGVLFSM